MSELDPSAEANQADAPADESGAPRAEDTASPEAQAKPRPDELRLTRPTEGAAPLPIEVFRLRSREGTGELEIIDAGDAPGGLRVPGGVAGDVERALGRGETDRARSLAAPLEGDGGTGEGLSDAECLQRTLVVRAHLMDGNLEAARAVLGRARDDARLALADAALCLGEGQLEQARKRIELALEQTPDGLGEHYTLALILVAEGRLPEAMATLARVAASEPGHAVARHQLGQLTLAHGDPARAGTLFEMAIEAAPGFMPPALALAEMLMESRQYGEAMNLLTRVTERAPSALAPHLLQLRLLVEVGEIGAALQLGEGLRRAAPDHPEVAALWAEAMTQAGRGEEAAEKLDALVQAAQGDTKAKLLRVLAHIDLAAEPARVKSALLRLSEAVGEATSKGELRLELAELHLGVGEHESAGKALSALAQESQVEVGHLLQGALLARNHGLWASARQLGLVALERVRGNPAEPQIAAFIAALPPGE